MSSGRASLQVLNSDADAEIEKLTAARQNEEISTEEFEEQLAELKAQKEAARRAALSGKSYNGQEIDYDVSNDEIDAVLTAEEEEADTFFRSLESLFKGAVEHLSQQAVIDNLNEGKHLVPAFLSYNKALADPKLHRERFLHIAARLRKEKICDFLCQNGADPNIRSEEGLTPFHLICEQAGKKYALDIIKTMMRHDADINLPDDKGEDGVMKAEKAGIDLLKLDVKMRENILTQFTESEKTEMKRKAGITFNKLCKLFPLLTPEGENEKNILSLLQAQTEAVALGFLDLNKPCNQEDMKTFLHIAVENASVVLVKQILGPSFNKQANPNCQNAEGETPLHIACERYSENKKERENKEIIELLRVCGADVTMTTFILGSVADDLLPSAELADWFKNWQPTGKESFDVPQLAQKVSSIKKMSSKKKGKKTEMENLKGLADLKQKKKKDKKKKKKNEQVGESEKKKADKEGTLGKGEAEEPEAKKALGGLNVSDMAGVQALMDGIRDRENVGSSADAAFFASMYSRQTVSRSDVKYLPQQIYSLFSLLDVGGHGSLSPEDLHQYHLSVHHCDMSLQAVEKILIGKGTCKLENFLEFNQLITIACTRDQGLFWDFASLDSDQCSHLDAACAEMVWGRHELDRDQISYEKYIESRRERPGKAKDLIDHDGDTYISWTGFDTQLTARPVLKDFGL